MKIVYGTESANIDITNFCITNLLENDKITIPAGEKVRNLLFSDPVPNVNKKLFVQNNNNSLFFSYDNTEEVNIYLKNTDGIFKLHENLKINHGSLKEELPEQRLAYMFLKGDETILEIGGNIGRNSLVMANILTDDKRLVVLESDENNARILNENKDLNNLNFNIEAKALCKNKLMQQGWITSEGDELKEGYRWVETCDYNYLKDKYQLKFDTIVADCEGAFYYILRDFPEVLDGVNLVIMENDYTSIDNYNYVADSLTKNGLKKVYMEYLIDANWSPCVRNFFEVWKRTNTNDVYISQHL
jgi:FkbM family methyltransferase